MLLGCFTGFVLRGSAEGAHAASVMLGLVRSLPGLGELLGRCLYRPDPAAQALGLPYLHHLATVAAGLLYLGAEHYGRLRRSASTLAWAALLAGLLALVFAVPTGQAPDSAPLAVHGPWFFVGVQQLLGWLPGLLVGVVLPLSPLLLLWVQPWLGPRGRRASRWALALGLSAYAGLSLFALLG